MGYSRRHFTGALQLIEDPSGDYALDTYFSEYEVKCGLSRLNFEQGTKFRLHGRGVLTVNGNTLIDSRGRVVLDTYFDKKGKK